MSPTEDLLSVAGAVTAVLKGLNLPFALGGALAQNFWGTVRATQDIDILVALPRVRFEELARALREAGFTGRDPRGRSVLLSATEMAREETASRLFKAYKGLVKVEFFLPFLPLQRSILQRARELSLGGFHAPITSAEDLVVLKMAFHRDKDLRDVRGILLAQKGKLDLAYIREWAAKMLLEESQQELEAWIGKYCGD